MIRKIIHAVPFVTMKRIRMKNVAVSDLLNYAIPDENNCFCWKCLRMMGIQTAQNDAVTI